MTLYSEYMNNTTRRNLTIVAVFIAASLVVGTFAATPTTQTALAYQKKKDNGKGGNGNGNTITIQKCKQAATQSGFDNNQGQECENLICTHPGENATCVQEGAVSAAAAAPAQTPVKLTCEQCFTKFLSPGQITGVLNGRTPETACPVFRSGVVLSESEFRNALGDAKVDLTIANELIACLRDAGVLFGP
jgi:hypothetical protein